MTASLNEKSRSSSHHYYSSSSKNIVFVEHLNLSTAYSVFTVIILSSQQVWKVGVIILFYRWGNWQGLGILNKITLLGCDTSRIWSQVCLITKPVLLIISLLHYKVGILRKIHDEWSYFTASELSIINRDLYR